MTVTTPSPTTRPATCTHAQIHSTSLAEERREVFESVLAALVHDPLDADRLAASGYLLRHLSRTAVPPS